MNTVETSPGRGIVAGPSRRGFLEGIGTTAFFLAFQLPVSPGRAGEPSWVSGQFNAFLAIGEDDVVTAIIAQTEGGQGNSIGMTQVIAAELGAAWPRMRYRFTTERRPEYINPMLRDQVRSGRSRRPLAEHPTGPTADRSGEAPFERAAEALPEPAPWPRPPPVVQM